MVYAMERWGRSFSTLCKLAEGKVESTGAPQHPRKVYKVLCFIFLRH